MALTQLELDIFIRLLLASLLGGLIGLERELHGRPAGFRTHLLVSLGSALFVAVSINFYHVYGNFTGSAPVGVDPGRVAAQVVTGIGFLGAGAIIREKGSIRGLTTAACLWVAAAIGVASGSGMFSASLLVTAIALLSLLILKKVESVLSKDTYMQLDILSSDIRGQADKIKKIVDGCGAELLDNGMEWHLDEGTIRMEFRIKVSAKDWKACSLIDLLAGVEGIRRVSVR